MAQRVDNNDNPVREDGTPLWNIESIPTGEKYIVGAGVALPIKDLPGEYRPAINTYYDTAIHLESKVYTKD